MKEELRSYIDKLFADAPKTRAAFELKEELMANSMERYQDLINDRVPEKEAFDIVIHSIGDISQLFSENEEKTAHQPVNDGIRKKTALYRSAAVGLYILGFCAMIIIREFTSFGTLGFVAMLLFFAVATCILVYMSSAYPSYRRCDDTVAEEFKEWNSGQKKNQAVHQLVDTIVWMLVLIIYFFLSFTTGEWKITWIIFLIGVCAQEVVDLIFKLKEY